MSRPASAARTGTGSSTATNASRDSQFTALTPDELDALIGHVRGSDYPESMESWAALGREAGFAKTELVFTGSPDLLRTFCFSG